MVQRHKIDVDYTEFESYIEQPENVDRLLELINGEIVEKVPTEEHGLIVGNIFAPMHSFAKQHKLGRVATEVLHRRPTDEKNGLLPDISFRSDRSSPVVRKGAVAAMPDLAVEVQSPSQSDKFLEDKAAYYLANGSQMVWLVFPTKHTVDVYSAGKVQTFTEADTLSGGDTLPGFELPVSDIFDLD